MKNTNKKSGFTLVELAIVLVIIGLIVGGVLAGQDLIKAAEQRAAIGQIEKLDTVVNAFRGKYNGIPGDLPNPTGFGFQAPSAAAVLGNGVLNPQGGALLEEVGMFFSHLASAGLINESLNAQTADVTTGGVTVNTPGDYVPISKLGKGVSIWAVSDAGINYYMLDAITALTNAGAITHGRDMQVITAYNMDTKLDDGIPATGKVVAVTNVSTLDAGAALNNAATDCVVSTTPTAYQNDQNKDNANCALRIKASF